MTDAPIERGGEGALSKLRDRKVVQWGLGYSAAAWTLLQLIDYLSETYGWPPAVRQLTTPALGFGLSFVLVIAWYHGDRGDQQVSKPELAILFGLAALLGGGLWWFAERLDVSAWDAMTVGQVVQRAVPQDAASVAVLPFVNMSGDPANEYFSDGLSEEILNALSSIPRLYVPARTSSFYFKGRKEDVAVIAARLGVATVLEGSVRKSGNRVRITAQLVNASDGYHVWSQTYDRQLKDIFAVQEEVSRAIADALRIQLTAEQKLAAMPLPLTSSTDAYEAYLLGRFELNQRGDHVAKAVQHLERAVELDPQFAVAWADLAVAQCLLENYSPPGEKAGLLAKAREIVARAMALDPSRPEVLAAAGFVEWTDYRLDRGLELIDRSLELRPNNGEALAWRRRLLGQLRRYDEVLAASYESVKRDPLSWLALNNHVTVLREFGRGSEIPPVLDRLRTLKPDRAEAWLTILSRDDLDLPAAVRHCIVETELAGRDACAEYWTLATLGLRDEVARVVDPWDVHILFGEYAEALPLIRKAYADGAGYRMSLVNALLENGLYDEGLALFEDEIRETGDVAWSGWDEEGAWLTALAFAARLAGHPEAAQGYRDRAAENLASLERAGFVTFGWRARARATLHAFDGDLERAAASALLAIRTDPAMWWLLSRDPFLASVVALPEMQAAIRERRTVVARQRVEVLEMLCGQNPVSKSYKPAPGTCREESLRTRPPANGTKRPAA